MAEPVGVAIESALLSRAQAFAAAQSPVLAIALPNVAFTKPTPGPAAKYLEATFMPVQSVEMGVSFDAHVQHYGLLQISVFYGLGAGEYAPGRIASQIIQYFARGTVLIKDGFKVRIDKAPFRGPLIKDDTWMQVPVSIPYQCFARPA
ncbi:MAG: hypothetical protein JWQ16_1383 [Novosphingobium sp.]|nr:hypothetical protein [Novosphingobium sp.]